MTTNLPNSQVNIIELPEQSVVWLEIPEVLTFANVEQYTNRFSAAVAQNQPFGCIFSYLAGKPKKSMDANKLENEWLRLHKSKLSELCFGIAMVSNPSVHSLLMKIVIKGLGKQVLGCECNLFSTVEDAKTWLLARKSLVS